MGVIATRAQIEKLLNENQSLQTAIDKAHQIMDQYRSEIKLEFEEQQNKYDNHVFSLKDQINELRTRLSNAELK